MAPKETGFADADGHFKRRDSSFRNLIEPGGQFPPERDRYHLYVAYSCPWACRTLIMRHLKGLQDLIPISVVTAPREELGGWCFASAPDAYPGADEDPCLGAKYIKDLYFKVEPGYTGRFTVPLLWDKKQNLIVNNESSEIIRIFNSAFDDLLPAKTKTLDFYPLELRPQIDEINQWVYDTVNNGVYKCGFAATQEAYEAAIKPLFASLDRLEAILADGPREYLVGGTLTEADLRLFTTIVRFDPVYYDHFKCNVRSIRHGYPNLNRWLRNLYWKEEAFKSATRFKEIKEGYYRRLVQNNPTKIVPVGPVPDIEPLL